MQSQKKPTSARVGFFGTPPVRYTGAKWQLAEWIIDQFPPHDVYCEPFCGGASVFFRKHRSPVEILNDLDGDVINFFDVLRTREDDLIRAIEFTPFARYEYERALQPAVDPLERARRFYVAVWQSFGGTLIYRSGWRHQRTSKHRSAAVDNWRRVDGLYDAAWRLKDAQIECRPAIDCIQHYDGPNTLFYVDPPYIKSARSGGRNRYRHEMTNNDHRLLADILNQVKGMVVLSGYDSPEYAEWFAGWQRLERGTTTNGNSTRVEVLWLSPSVRNNQLPLFSVR